MEKSTADVKTYFVTSTGISFCLYFGRKLSLIPGQDCLDMGGSEAKPETAILVFDYAASGDQLDLTPGRIFYFSILKIYSTRAADGSESETGGSFLRSASRFWL